MQFSRTLDLDLAPSMNGIPGLPLWYLTNDRASCAEVHLLVSASFCSSLTNSEFSGFMLWKRGKKR